MCSTRVLVPALLRGQSRPSTPAALACVLRETFYGCRYG